MDVIVIGAGAAGLAAAARLALAHRVVVLEAGPRLGGRIFTHSLPALASFPLELGAELIHGSRVVTRALAAQAGLTTLPVDRLGNLRWGRPARPLAHLPEDERAMIDGLWADYDALRDAVLAADCSLEHWLRGRGWDGAALDAADVLLAQTCCARLDRLSALDLQREMHVDHSGGLEHGEARLAQGYNTLLAWLARGLDVRLGAPVHTVVRTARGVRVHSAAGVFAADACLVTASVAALQRGLIAFQPALTAHKRDAIAAMRMEPGSKLFYRFRERLWPADLTYMAGPGLAARWWTPGYGRAQAEPVITAYVTADRARALDALGGGDAEIVLGHGLRDLAALLGETPARLEDARVASHLQAWARAPWVGGAYAHVPPGAADARLALAAPEAGGLFFAGEATAHDTNPQTVHGAIESGWRAAAEISAWGAAG
jgi:monoamine oxidase